MFLSFPKVQGMVFGNFGEASEAVHTLVKDRVRVACPSVGGRGGGEGLDRSEEGEKAVSL